MEGLIPDIPVIEKLVRTAVIYGFLLVAFRLAGKRQLGQMSPFDLIVLLVISNAVQNALIGEDNSLGGGLIGAATLLVINSVVAWTGTNVASRFDPALQTDLEESESSTRSARD